MIRNLIKRLTNRFKQHTTIRPRYLRNTYTDERELLVHINFELLMRFVESEWIDHIDWYESNHKIGDEFVIDIWLRLYEWYKVDYMRYYRGGYANEIYANCPEPIEWCHPIPNSDMYEFELKFANEDDERKYEDCMRQLHDLDTHYEQMTQDNLKSLIDTRPYMWT